MKNFTIDEFMKEIGKNPKVTTSIYDKIGSHFINGVEIMINKYTIIHGDLNELFSIVIIYPYFENLNNFFQLEFAVKNNSFKDKENLSKFHCGEDNIFKTKDKFFQAKVLGVVLHGNRKYLALKIDEKKFYLFEVIGNDVLYLQLI